jgi:bifunctional isochorismate lyase/aryl carrier protein
MPARLEWPWARCRDLPDLGQAALLVIDAQHAFLDPSSPIVLPDAEPCLPRIVRLLDAFACRGLFTVATRHAHAAVPARGGMGSWWSSFLLEGTRETALAPEVAARASVIVSKQHYSAFRDTVLAERLRGQGARTVVLAGFMTHVCVDTTARDAFQLGFDVVVVHDACASRDPRLHQASLQCLSHAVARLGSTAEVLGALAHAAAGLRAAAQPTAELGPGGREAEGEP